MLNKKGVSGVIFTIIMVVLVLAAVTIIWGVVKGIISKSTDDIALSSLTLDIEILSTSINGQDVSVNVKRNSGKGNLTGIKFVFSDGKNTEFQETNIALKELEARSFSFTLNNLNASKLTSISIAPIFISSSGKKMLGEISYIANSGSGGWGAGSGGGGSSGSVSVILTANPMTVSSGSNSALTWSATNADSCTALEMWSGTKATSGLETVGPLNSDSTFTLSCMNSGGSSSDSVTVTVTSATAPVLSGGNPSGTLAAGTTQTTLNLTTNVDATCRYSITPDVNYSAMTNTFSTTGLTTHSELITGLTNGTSYDYYVRCQDGLGNTNTNDYTISFSVDSGTAPVCGNNVTESGEGCDDGNTNNNDNCIIDSGNSYECMYAVCGDGYMWNESGGNEECDDDNTVPGDGCSDTCQTEIPLNNTGIVDLTWPPGMNLYFDSYNLSTIVSYTGKFVRFPGGAETRCLEITDYILPSEPLVYNKSFARLGTPNDESSLVSSGDNYEVWNFPGCGT